MSEIVSFPSRALLTEGSGNVQEIPTFVPCLLLLDILSSQHSKKDRGLQCVKDNVSIAPVPPSTVRWKIQFNKPATP